MQATRERILTIMKEREAVTVDELSDELELTAVTVRHHLDILRGQGLVASPSIRRRRAPGRPQYVYALTDDASEWFPKSYDRLSALLLTELQERLADEEIEDILRCIGRRLAARVSLDGEDSFEEHLHALVEYLDSEGYLANWERQDDENEPSRYLLHICNCPYEFVAREHPSVCLVDTTMLEELLDIPLERIEDAGRDGSQCTYTFQAPKT